MVAERRVELDFLVEERFVRLLELVHEVLGPLRAVQVVAEHDGEGERKLREILDDRRGGFVLLGVARAAVTDDQETDRVGLERKPELKILPASAEAAAGGRNERKAERERNGRQ